MTLKVETASDGQTAASVREWMARERDTGTGGSM